MVASRAACGAALSLLPALLSRHGSSGHKRTAVGMSPDPLPPSVFVWAEEPAFAEGTAITDRSLEDAAQYWMDEMNSDHVDELQQVARLCPAGREVDWSLEELHRVEIVSVSDEYIVLQEVLCSASDQRCVALDVAVEWPSGMCPVTVEQLRAAFSALAASLSSVDEGMMPVVYERQQQLLDGAMAYMNSQHTKLLKYYAYRHARDAFSASEELLSAKMIQLTFEGLSLEVESIELADAMLAEPQTTTSAFQRRRTQVSILFDSPCESTEQVEDKLIGMFAYEETGEAS